MSVKIISRGRMFAGLYFRDFFPQAAKPTTRFQTRPNFLSSLQKGRTRRLPPVPKRVHVSPRLRSKVHRKSWADRGRSRL